MDAFAGLPIDRTHANKTRHRWVRRRPIRGILLHGSGSLMSDTDLTIWGNRQRVSWNFSVDSDSITVMVDPQFGTVHAGIESFIPSLNLREGELNDQMISIEFRDTNKSGSLWSEGQFRLGVRLCAALCRMFNLSPRNIFTHRQVSVWWKERFDPSNAHRPRKIDPVGLRELERFIRAVEAELKGPVPSPTTRRPGIYRLTDVVLVRQGPGFNFPGTLSLAAGTQVDIDVTKHQSGSAEAWGHLFGPSSLRNAGFIPLVAVEFLQPKWFIAGSYTTVDRVNLRTRPTREANTGKVLVAKGTMIDIVDFEAGEEVVAGIHLWGVVGTPKYRGLYVYMGTVAPAARPTVAMRASSAISTAVHAVAQLPILGAGLSSDVDQADCPCPHPSEEDYASVGL